MKQTEHEGQMNVFKQGKADEFNILEDEFLRKTINAIFDKPVETLDILQTRLLGKPGRRTKACYRHLLRQMNSPKLRFLQISWLK